MGIFEFLFGSSPKPEVLVPVPDPAEVSLQKLSLAHTEMEAMVLPSYLKFRISRILGILDSILANANKDDNSSLAEQNAELELLAKQKPEVVTEKITEETPVVDTVIQENSFTRLLTSFSHAEIGVHEFLIKILDYLDEKIQRYQKLPKNWANSRPVEDGYTPLLLLIDKLDSLAHNLALLAQEDSPLQNEKFYVAELWIDPRWYAKLEPEEAMPELNEPRVIPLFTDNLEIGRVSDKPVIDCGNDVGVSRKHAKLQLIDGHWKITDLGSRNGTYLGVVNADLPSKAISEAQEISDFHRIYLGSWTRLVVRPARSEEISGKGE